MIPSIEEKGKEPFSLDLKPTNLPKGAFHPSEALCHVLSLNGRKVMEGGVEVPVSKIQAEFEASLCTQRGFELNDSQKKILENIFSKEQDLTPNSLARIVCNKEYVLKDGDTPLHHYKFSRQEVLKAALTFIEFSTLKKWDKWFETFGPKAVYIADSNTVLQGKRIEKVIGEQLELVPDMDYSIVGLGIEGNRIFIRSVNILKPEGGEAITFLNDTILYYEGLNKDGEVIIRYNEDVIDKGVAEARVKQYLLKDCCNCGGALLKVFTALCS